MQYKNNRILDQAVIDQKQGILDQFLENAARLSGAKTEADIAQLTLLHNASKEQLKNLRQQGLLTAEEIHSIVKTFDALSGNVVLRKSKSFDYLQDFHEFSDWKAYEEALNLLPLIEALPDKLMLAIKQYEQEDHYTKHGEDNYNEIYTEARRVIKAYEAKQLTEEQIAPLISALVNFYLQIMNRMAHQEFKVEDSLRSCRSNTEQLLRKLRDLQLISGEEAYQIAGAYTIEAMVYKTKGFDIGSEESMDWKNYAASVGSSYALLELNDEHKKFIREAWKTFLKDTAPVMGIKFHNSVDRTNAFNVQKQLDDISMHPSASSAKKMLQVIAAFYLAQSPTKSYKDNFLHKLSEVLIDILLKMSESDKKIKAVIEEEGKNAYILVNKKQGEPKADELKDLLLKSSSITLKNILTSLHVTLPELDRSSDLGPAYRNDPGHGL